MVMELFAITLVALLGVSAIGVVGFVGLLMRISRVRAEIPHQQLGTVHRDLFTLKSQMAPVLLRQTRHEWSEALAAPYQ